MPEEKAEHIGFVPADSIEVNGRFGGGVGFHEKGDRAGFPATVASAGTSRVTTAPAPTMAFSPIVILGKMIAPAPTSAPDSILAFPPMTAPGPSEAKSPSCTW